MEIADENKVQNICSVIGVPFTYALAMYTKICLEGIVKKKEIKGTILGFNLRRRL
jgi:hypothetical protein